LDDDIDTFKKQGHLESRWSCGITKKIVPGDRVFLMKLGKEEPKGIMASGRAVSHVREEKHWYEYNSTALYLDVNFDVLLDPYKIIFPISDLSKGIYSKMNWTPQASGRTIPDDVAAQLEFDWKNFLKQFNLSSELTLPEEADFSETFREGAAKQIWVNSYERSAEARSVCIIPILHCNHPLIASEI